jgi:ribosomal protein S18 acetylase RimI-like enzyme
VVVHPDFFRRGIGRQMVRFVENLYKDAKKIIVATGSKNYPAVELYKRMGYVVIGEKEVAAGVNVTMFSKRI